MKTVFVFGNPDVPQDSLPVRLLPALRKKFPAIDFQVKDPNEEWEISENEVLTIIDSAEGIREVTVFDSLERFVAAPRLTMHDFDALANLRLLQKLGKIKKIKVIGIPPAMPEQEALQKISAALSDLEDR